MSYAGKVARGRNAATQEMRRWEGGAGPLRAEPRTTRPEAPDSAVDWKQIAVFVSGVAVGLTVGAGVALLVAPQSGRETRRDLAKRGRRLRHRSADAWDDLRHELRQAARRGRRSLARSIRSRWERRAESEDEEP
jgi:gas vesicle protein